MYIEFDLPGHSAADAGNANYIIDRELKKWADQYGIAYRVKNIKHTKRVTFDTDAHYSLFAMTWNMHRKFSYLARWRIVRDLNNKTAFDSSV